MTLQLFMSTLAYLLLILPAAQIFASEHFLLMNGMTEEILVKSGSSIDDRMSPCSTFKIVLSLMGYDAGILEDENNPIWEFQDGYDDDLIAWKAAHTPASWMQHSCLWYSKILALQLGKEKIQRYLDGMEYGNRDLAGDLGLPGGASTVAWINSSIKISLKEQVDFMRKMVRHKLPISSRAIETTKAILFKEELPNGWKLFGKTGWSGSRVAREGKVLEHSWFVGWIEKDGQHYPFAYLICEKHINLDQRIPRVKELLLKTRLFFLEHR